MIRFPRFCQTFTCALMLATASTNAAVAAPTQAPSPVVTILISIDGFRSDYLDRGETPVLKALADRGVRAAMHPSFPSKTFPNHWALVTGKVPDRNGIVSHGMRDPARPNEKFSLGNDDPFWWNEASPIWVDAEKSGIRTGVMFWPGGNVAWGGVMAKNEHHDVAGGIRPHDWYQYNAATTGLQRVDTILDWTRRPPDTRPTFMALYFDTVDRAGHDFGPDAPETDQAIKDIDGAIGKLVQGLAALGQTANLVIVSDHGMTAISDERIISLDELADPADFQALETGVYAPIYPVAGHEKALEAALFKPHAHVQCWKKGEIPARFQYGRNPRVAPYFCLADVGWLIKDKAEVSGNHGGSHGYDNMAPQMAALFIANGPAFAAGRTLKPFDNVDIVPLLRDVLGLPSGKDLDGTDAPFRAILRDKPPLEQNVTNNQ